MIVDNIKNAENYFNLGEDIKIALKYLDETDFTKLEKGKHQIDGDRIFAILNEYETKDIEDSLYEAHKKYIDIQYVVGGEENIGYSFIKNLDVTKEYDEENDYMLLDGEGCLIEAGQGTFFVFFPQDAHKPGLKINESKPVKKVIVKIKL